MNYRLSRVRHIAERESEREKRGMVESILVQKLLSMHSNKSPHPLGKRVIINAVKDYINHEPSVIFKINLRNTEESITEISKRAIELSIKKSGNKNSKDNSNVDEIKHSATDGNSIHKGRPIIPNANNTPVLLNVNPWNLLEVSKAVEEEEVAEFDRKKVDSKRCNMKSYLDHQIRLKNKADLEAKKNDEIIVKTQFDELNRWKDEQREISRVEREKSLELRRVRQEQMLELKQRKTLESKRERSEQISEMSNLKKLLQQEEDDKRKKKLDEKRKWEEMKKERQIELNKREKIKQNEIEMDAKLMEDTKQKLDKEEKNRLKELEDRTARRVSITNKMSEGSTFNKREEMVRFEKLLLEQATEREKSEREKEHKEREMKQNKIRIITETNLKLAEEKHSREREIQKAEEEYATQCFREKEALLAEEESKRMKVVKTKKEYSEVLNRQKEDQQKLKDSLNEMTATERSINKKLLGKIDTCPCFRHKVISRLNNGAFSTTS